MVPPQKTSHSPLDLRKERAIGGKFSISYLSDTPPSWKVESGSGHTYHVLLPDAPSREGAQCSCPDFLTRNLGTCKHVEAVLAFVALNPPPRAKAAVPSGISWAEIEKTYGDEVQHILNEHLSPEEMARELRKRSRPLLK
jgi:hypothetical protein